MRKLVALGLVVLVASGLFLNGVPVAKAQGGTLELGQWVEGELTSVQYEQTYTFAGKAGMLVMVEMTTSADSSLDPALLLRDSGGTPLGQNDDFEYLDALVIAELPADGEYTVVATRSGGATGDSEGAYGLRVSAVVLTKPGDTVEATVLSNYELDKPTYFVLMTDTAATWAITFNQPAGELHASLSLTSYPDDDTAFELGETTALRSGTLNVDLEAGMMYLLIVKQSWGSFVWEDTSMVVTISISEAQ